MKAEFTKKEKCVFDVFAQDVRTGTSIPLKLEGNLPQILSKRCEFSLRTVMQLISLISPPNLNEI